MCIEWKYYILSKDNHKTEEQYQPKNNKKWRIDDRIDLNGNIYAVNCRRSTAVKVVVKYNKNHIFLVSGEDHTTCSSSRVLQTLQLVVYATFPHNQNS
jgi:hypothetical protein